MPCRRRRTAICRYPRPEHVRPGLGGHTHRRRRHRLHDSGGSFFPGRENRRPTADDMPCDDYTAEFEVREDSRIVGRTLEETGIASGDNVEVLYIRQGGTNPDQRPDA
jgi:hypothetical protein